MRIKTENNRSAKLGEMLTKRSTASVLMLILFIAIMGAAFVFGRIAFVETPNGTYVTVSKDGESAAKRLDVIPDDYEHTVKKSALYDTVTLCSPEQIAQAERQHRTIFLHSLHQIRAEQNEGKEPQIPYLPENTDAAASPNAYLSELGLKDTKLSPEFSPVLYEYEATVESETESVAVEAKADSESAAVDIKGGEKLETGKNEITVTVVSESGDVSKAYKIIVNKKKPVIKEEPDTKEESNTKEKSDSKDDSAESKPASKPKGHSGSSSSSPVSELKAPHIELDSNGQPLNYKKLITGKATAYYNPSGNKLATGKSFKPGYVAVNPKQIPYGTKMYIVSPKGGFVYGYAIAADTGGFAKNGSGTVVDLAFWTKSEVNNFGRRTMNIYILE